MSARFPCIGPGLFSHGECCFERHIPHESPAVRAVQRTAPIHVSADHPGGKPPAHASISSAPTYLVPADCALLTCGFVAPALLRSTGVNREVAASLRDRLPAPRTVAAWRTYTMVKRATGGVERCAAMSRARAIAFASSGAADRCDDETGARPGERRGDMIRARETQWPSRWYHSCCTRPTAGLRMSGVGRGFCRPTTPTAVS